MKSSIAFTICFLVAIAAGYAWSKDDYKEGLREGKIIGYSDGYKDAVSENKITIRAIGMCEYAEKFSQSLMCKGIIK